MSLRPRIFERWCGVFLFLVFAGAAFAGGDLFDQLTEEQERQARGEVKSMEEKLNVSYQRLLQQLNDAGKADARNVERGWVAFKDRDLEFFFDLAKAVKAQSRSYIYIQREYGKQTSYLDFMASPQEREVGFDKDDPIASIRDVAQADRILNNLYQRCLALVPEEKRSEFRQIQLSWIQFNEGFCGFAARLKGGEAQDSVRVQLTLRRAIQFRYYLPVLLAYQLPFNPVSKSISEVVYGEGESKSVDPAIPDVYRFAR